VAGRFVTERRMVRVRDGRPTRARDRLIVEEPLELRVAGRPVGVTMRTPGADVELAIGYCITEGLIAAHDQIQTVRACEAKGESGEYNTLSVELRPGVPAPDPSLDRLHVTSSSCGVCGKSSIDAVRVRCAPLDGDELVVDAATLSTIPGRVRDAQRLFEQTGGLHAAALVEPDGRVLCVREDVGRHNAVDKVAGWAAMNGLLPAAGRILFVSGRCSFELAQKAAVAGIPLIAAVSAPSGLAVTLAEELGMTVVGFLRGTSMNIYTRPDRVRLDEAAEGAAAPLTGRAPGRAS
jgi:FdhD protein